MQLVGDGLVANRGGVWVEGRRGIFCAFTLDVLELALWVGVVWLAALVDLGGERRSRQKVLSFLFFFLLCVCLYSDLKKRKTKNKRQKKETEDIGAERPRSVLCLTSSVLSENVGN